MNFKRITNVDGASLQGYLMKGTTYEDLVKAFGEPTPGFDSKTLVEWNLLFGRRTIVSIYDYKSGASRPEDITRWHVGGLSTQAVDLVLEVLAGVK